MLVLGPGTGFGAAALVWQDCRLRDPDRDRGRAQYIAGNVVARRRDHCAFARPLRACVDRARGVRPGPGKSLQCNCRCGRPERPRAQSERHYQRGLARELRRQPDGAGDVLRHAGTGRRQSGAHVPRRRRRLHCRRHCAAHCRVSGNVGLSRPFRIQGAVSDVSATHPDQRHCPSLSVISRLAGAHRDHGQPTLR